MNQDIRLERVSRNRPLPLSIEQYRLWFLQQLDPESIHFNMNLAFYVNGALDETLFEKSLNEVVRRHESLRTVFQMRGYEQQQIILDERWISIQRTELLSGEEGEREERTAALMHEDIQTPFSLETGPLLRVKLYQLKADKRILLLTLHQIIADLVSLNKIVEELVFYYRAHIHNEPSELPPLPIQFADYACWQRQKMRGNWYGKQLSYWKEKLSGELPVLGISADRPRSAVASHNGARTQFVIPADLTAKLKSFSRNNGVTLFITLLTAYQTVLAHYSGQEDICVGTSVTTRNQPELQGVIGLFVNTLVLRTSLEGNPTFAELLKRTRKTAFGAFAHQDIPYERLIEEIQAGRKMSHNPFFQTMFMLLQATEEDLTVLSGPAITPFEFKKKASALELTFTITEQRDILAATMDYNTDLYDSSTVDLFLQHFQHVLKTVVDDVQQPIQQLPLTGDEERRTFLRS